MALHPLMRNLELYESQKLFIRDAKGIIESGGIGMFSSPTGTGKTISLLTAVADHIALAEETNLTLENQLLEQLLFQKSKKTTVFYSARTHTQLSQAIGELKGLDIKCNSVVLGSRRIYCINSKASEGGSLDCINEKCRQMVREDSCQFYKGCEAFDGHGVLDIEDLVDDGKREGFCPYYTAKKYSHGCEIVFLPYQLLFTKEGRKSAGIDVKGAIVIVDEAHNIYDSVIQMNTVSVSFEVICRYIKALHLYRERYLARMRNARLLESTMEILKRIDGFRSGSSLEGAEDEAVMTVSEFLIKAKIEDFNMLEIEDYLVTAELSSKLEGFGTDLSMQLVNITQFLSLLVMSDSSGRIFYNKKRIRFTPLDPSMYFSDILECKALLLAGGTMEPINSLASVFGKRSYRHFSYGSVCKDFLPLSMKSGPSGKEILVNYGTRENFDAIKDVVSSISNLSNTVKSGGMVCFLPSKAYLKIFRDRCGDLLNKKKILYEDAATFEEYSHEVRRSPCVLFAVMGGRLSEGINFNDELCRLLVVVGVPYPSQSIEMMERTKFNGEGYSTLIAMKTVNQALGRALRHKSDFAVLILLDKRYTQLSRFISPWIREKLVTCDFRDGFARANSFLNHTR